MSISLSGRFDYVAVVPASGQDRGRWDVQLRNPIELTGHKMQDDRLVGHSPALTISGGGLTPNAGLGRPLVLRSRITLTAASPKHAYVRSVAFHVDQALTNALMAHDTLFMARTACGGLALSIVRDHRLIAAVGAASAVPLGETVSVRIPWDPVREAERVLQKHDAEFAFREYPVEVQLHGHKRVLYGGRPQLGAYDVFVGHGFYPGLPGTNECVAVSLRGACPDVVAIASAQLLDGANALDITGW